MFFGCVTECDVNNARMPGFALITRACNSAVNADQGPCKFNRLPSLETVMPAASSSTRIDAGEGALTGSP